MAVAKGARGLTQAGWLGQVEQMAQVGWFPGLGVVEVEFVREGRRCILRVFLESERALPWMVPKGQRTIQRPVG